MTKVNATPAADNQNVNNDNPFAGTTKKVIPQNSKQAEKLLKKADTKAPKTGKTETPAPKTEKVKKVKKERAESNEHIGERLYAEKASKETVLATFLKVYKDKKGITDKKFVQARADIYMAIAAKRAEGKAKTQAPAEKEKKAEKKASKAA